MGYIKRTARGYKKCTKAEFNKILRKEIGGML